MVSGWIATMPPGLGSTKPQAYNRHYVRLMCGSFRLQAQALPVAEATASTLNPWSIGVGWQRSVGPSMSLRRAFGLGVRVERFGSASLCGQHFEEPILLRTGTLMAATRKPSATADEVVASSLVRNVTVLIGRGGNLPNISPK